MARTGVRALPAAAVSATAVSATAVSATAVSAILLSAVVGGAQPRPPRRPTSPPASQPQTMSPLHRARTSGYRFPETTVFRDSAAWATAWTQLHDGMRAPPLPPVDFARESVVLVALGERSSGGYDVRVERVARAGAAAVVHYTATGPGPGCMSTQALTSPVDVVRVPRLPASVQFQRRAVTTPC